MRKMRLGIEKSNKEISKRCMVYHHWAPTSQDKAAAIVTFYKMSIFCQRHFWKTFTINKFQKCS